VPLPQHGEERRLYGAVPEIATRVGRQKRDREVVPYVHLAER
jgi:hypothetical protein